MFPTCFICVYPDDFNVVLEFVCDGITLILKDSFLFGESLWKFNTIQNSRNIKNRMRSFMF